MKTTLLILTLFGLFQSTHAQVINPDSVFFWEKATLQIGKNWQKWTGDLKEQENTGFVCRASTGYWADTRDKFASMVSVNMQGGYKWHFLEGGIKLSQTVASLGTDNWSVSTFTTPISPVTPTTTFYYYNRPTNQGIQSAWLYTGIHFPIAKVPFFMQFGLGKMSRPTNNFNSFKVYYTDGSTQWAGIAPPITTTSRRSALLSVGASKGMFFGAIDYATGPYLDFFGNASSKLRFTNLHIGVQMAAGATPTHKDMSISGPDRHKKVHIGLSYYINAIASKNTATSNGNQIELGIQYSREWRIQAAYQWWNVAYGNQKALPSEADLLDAGGFIPLSNPLSGVKNTTLRFVREIRPDQPVHGELSVGGGWYRRRSDYFQFPGSYDKYNYGGLVIGGGLRYRILHSQLLIHKIIESVNYFPFYLEWSTGVRVSFGG